MDNVHKHGTCINMTLSICHTDAFEVTASLMERVTKLMADMQKHKRLFWKSAVVGLSQLCIMQVLYNQSEQYNLKNILTVICSH
jgi:hypothetical protein